MHLLGEEALVGPAGKHVENRAPRQLMRPDSHLILPAESDLKNNFFSNRPNVLRK